MEMVRYQNLVRAAGIDFRNDHAEPVNKKMTVPIIIEYFFSGDCDGK